MLSWHFITSEVYNNASDADKSDEKLFFLSDTHEIYRGKERFTESVILYSTEPTAKAIGKLYVNSTTLEGKIWDGSKWTTVIKPVVDAVTADGTDPVSGKAVAEYVAEQIAGVTGSKGLVASVGYTANTNSINVTMADGATDSISMTNVAADLVYDKTTGKLQVKNAAGTTIGTGINLDLERFISEASYDHETGIITLKFNDEGDPLEIDIGDLVDTYDANDTSTVTMTVTGNVFTAEVIVSTTAGNQLQKTDNGLYVAATDISGKMDKDTDATENNIAVFDKNGNAIDSGKTAGGAALAATPSESVLATEKAVDAIRTALTTLIAGKMDKVGTGKTNQVIIADADGNASASGKTIGDAAFADIPNANTLATEAGAAAYVDAAIESALTWKTTI